MMKLLIIDNYDSFTYTIASYFKILRCNVKIIKNDEDIFKTILDINPSRIVISPGPIDPSYSGSCKEIVKKYYKKIPILGICLGMQIINEIFGGLTVFSNSLLHGKSSDIFHFKNSLFKSIPSPFKAARYHSLMTTNISNKLKITAKTEDGIVMGFEHIKYPLSGIQFHPESFLTEHGLKIFQNFLNQD